MAFLGYLVKIMNTQADLAAYNGQQTVLRLADATDATGGTFFYYGIGYTVDNGIVFAATGKGGGYWVRQFGGDILPQWFGIKNDGTLISQVNLNRWLGACVRFNKPVHFLAGTYCFPQTFEYNFGSFDLLITGEKDKTIITTNDGTAALNFSVPKKLDITKSKPGTGIYQIDISGMPYNAAAISLLTHIHTDFKDLADKSLDAYVEISALGAVTNKTLAEVKALGYITELDTSTNTDPGIDGLYVVAKHMNFSYGGGWAHLNLRYANSVSGAASNFPTASANVLYVQGTILKRVSNVWSRFYAGAGFGTTGSFVVKNIKFIDVRFYLFSPFDIALVVTPQTSDIFSIENCSFNNCSRIIASMTYAGTDNDANWFKMSTAYENNGRFRFRNFKIIDNQFSYIHQSICWGPPPSQTTCITGNQVSNCYTIAATFYLLMTATVSNYWIGRISQTISNNSFIRIRPLNPGANWTLTIIRTTGIAVVNNNTYLDITQQAVYVSGGNATFSNNSVTKFVDDAVGTYTDCPVILSKLISDQGVIEVSGNTIISPASSLVQAEGGSCFNIKGNTFIGGTKYRFITRSTTEISPSRIYQVKHLQTFKDLANTDAFELAYASDIDVGHYVYFNKRKNMWEKLLMTFPQCFIYSKVDEFASAAQFVNIEGNTLLECENISRLGSGIQNTFRSIALKNNTIRYCNALHFGNLVKVEEYIIAGNYFRNATLSVNSNSSLTNQIKSLFFEGNKFAKSIGQLMLWAYQDLIFKNNTLFPDEEVNTANVYTDMGIAVPTYDHGVVLKGAAASKIVVEGNGFVTIHSRYSGLLLDKPFNAEIKNNVFDLNVPGALTHTDYHRAAVNINNTLAEPTNSLIFTDNTIYPQSSKTNLVLEFDDTDGTVASLTVNNNRIPLNDTDVTQTILGTKKAVTKYYKGKNIYKLVDDVVLSVGSIDSPK